MKGMSSTEQLERKQSGASITLQLLGWIAIFGGGGALVYSGRDVTIIALVVATGFMTVLLAQLERFDMLKGAGIEVKMRQVEKAKQEVHTALQEAKQATRGAEQAQVNIQHLAEQLIGAQLKELPFKGRWNSGPTMQEVFELRDAFLDVLEEVGTSAEQRDIVSRPFIKSMRLLLAMKYKGALQNAAQEAGNLNLQKELQNLGTKESIPPTNVLVKKMKDHDLETDQAKLYLKVLRQFEADGTLTDDYKES